MLNKGDRVMATQALGLMFAAVPKGTAGVVTRVGFFGGLTVDFENGRTVDVSEREVAKLNR